MRSFRPDVKQNIEGLNFMALRKMLIDKLGTQFTLVIYGSNHSPSTPHP